MAPRWTRVAALVAVVALAGCGGGSSKTSSTPAKASPVRSALNQRVLRAGEFPGFASTGAPDFAADAQAWARSAETSNPAKEAARLKALGFGGALADHLQATGSRPAAGLSLVQQMGSAGSARAELASEYKRTPAAEAFKPFPAPGIPGARGFDLVGSGHVGHNVVFADGRYYYLVGAGFPTGTPKAPTQAQVVSAAKTLYTRVHGLH